MDRGNISEKAFQRVRRSDQDMGQWLNPRVMSRIPYSLHHPPVPWNRRSDWCQYQPNFVPKQFAQQLTNC